MRGNAEKDNPLRRVFCFLPLDVFEKECAMPKNKKRPERVLTPEMLKSYKPKKNRIVEVNPKDSEKAFQFFIGKRSQPRGEKEN